MSPENVDLLKALIAAFATVAVAALGLYGVIRSASKPSTTKPPVNTDTGTALAQFNGTQNEFMALVIADNKTLRENQESQNRTMQELKSTVESIKDHQETFLSAVRRYLMKLATAWQGPTAMPWPDDEDFHILEDTLPQRGINRKDS